MPIISIITIGGCCSSVAECRKLMPEALFQFPVVPPFFWSLFRFKGLQTAMTRIASLIRHNHYWSSNHRGDPSTGLLPAVILLVIFHIRVDLSYIHSRFLHMQSPHASANNHKQARFFVGVPLLGCIDTVPIWKLAKTWENYVLVNIVWNLHGQDQERQLPNC